MDGWIRLVGLFVSINVLAEVSGADLQKGRGEMGGWVGVASAALLVYVRTIARFIDTIIAN